MTNIDDVTNALKRKGASNACARCGNTRFEVVGEVAITVMQQGSGLLSGLHDQMQTVPTVLVACSNCGNISHHALGILTKSKEVKWL